MSATNMELYHQPNGHLESGPQEMLRFPSTKNNFWLERTGDNPALKKIRKPILQNQFIRHCFHCMCACICISQLKTNKHHIHFLIAHSALTLQRIHVRLYKPGLVYGIWKTTAFGIAHFPRPHGKIWLHNFISKCPRYYGYLKS